MDRLSGGRGEQLHSDNLNEKNISYIERFFRVFSFVGANIDGYKKKRGIFYKISKKFEKEINQTYIYTDWGKHENFGPESEELIFDTTFCLKRALINCYLDISGVDKGYPIHHYYNFSPKGELTIFENKDKIIKSLEREVGIADYVSEIVAWNSLPSSYITNEVVSLRDKPKKSSKTKILEYPMKVDEKTILSICKWYKEILDLEPSYKKITNKEFEIELKLPKKKKNLPQELSHERYNYLKINGVKKDDVYKKLKNNLFATYLFYDKLDLKELKEKSEEQIDEILNIASTSELLIRKLDLLEGLWKDLQENNSPIKLNFKNYDSKLEIELSLPEFVNEHKQISPEAYVWCALQPLELCYIFEDKSFQEVKEKIM